MPPTAAAFFFIAVCGWMCWVHPHTAPQRTQEKKIIRQDVVLEVRKLHQEGFAAHIIVLQHLDTLPALLEDTNTLIQEVEGKVQQLKEIVYQLISR